MKIFISYRSVNLNLVENLITDLRDMGHEVWYDQHIEGGQKWWDNILDSIRQSELMIVALTPQLLDSYPCRLEYTYANAIRKHIIPVMLSADVNIPMLPVVLQERQIERYVEGNKDEYKALMHAISKLPPTPALPDPMPDPPPLPVSPLANIRTQIDSPSLTYEQQVTLFHQLKTFLPDPNYGGGARELLTRLMQHPMLLASVYNDIKTVLENPLPPQPEPSGNNPAPALDDPIQTTPVSLLDGERVIVTKKVAIFTGNWLWWPDKILTVTNQRLILKTPFSAVLHRDDIEIPYSEITGIKKTLKAGNPSVAIAVKPNIEHFLMVENGTGNREEFIKTIQYAMKGQS